MLPLIAILIFIAVALVASQLIQPQDNAVRRRIRGSDAIEIASERRLEGGLWQRLIGPGFVRVGAALARFLPANVLRGLEQMLIMANSKTSSSTFLAIWAATIGFGGLFCLYVLQSNARLSTPQAIVFGIFIMGLAGLAPYMLLRHRVKKRQKSIGRALPDALDLLVTGVEAGLAVDAAFALVTEKTSGPLSEAFTQYLRQVGLGRARRDAFLDIARRTGVPDLIRVAASVAQAEQMGAILGDVLRVQAGDLRLLRRQRAQERAQRAPVLMTIPMASCFLPAMGAVVIVPSVLNVASFFAKSGSRGLP